MPTREELQRAKLQMEKNLRVFSIFLRPYEREALAKLYYGLRKEHLKITQGIASKPPYYYLEHEDNKFILLQLHAAFKGYIGMLLRTFHRHQEEMDVALSRALFLSINSFLDLGTILLDYKSTGTWYLNYISSMDKLLQTLLIMIKEEQYSVQQIALAKKGDVRITDMRLRPATTQLNRLLADVEVMTEQSITDIKIIEMVGKDMLAGVVLSKRDDMQRAINELQTIATSWNLPSITRFCHLNAPNLLDEFKYPPEFLSQPISAQTWLGNLRGHFKSLHNVIAEARTQAGNKEREVLSRFTEIEAELLYIRNSLTFDLKVGLQQLIFDLERDLKSSKTPNDKFNLIVSRISPLYTQHGHTDQIESMNHLKKIADEAWKDPNSPPALLDCIRGAQEAFITEVEKYLSTLIRNAKPVMNQEIDPYEIPLSSEFVTQCKAVLARNLQSSSQNNTEIVYGISINDLSHHFLFPSLVLHLQILGRSRGNLLKESNFALMQRLIHGLEHQLAISKTGKIFWEPILIDSLGPASDFIVSQKPLGLEKNILCSIGLSSGKLRLNRHYSGGMRQIGKPESGKLHPNGTIELDLLDGAIMAILPKAYGV